MSTLQRTALLIGDEPALLERYVPFLRRSDFAIRKLLQPTGPVQLFEEAPKELLVIVPPIANAGRLFARARAVGSPWRHTGVVLIAERGERLRLDPALTRFANRMLPPEVSFDEFQQEVADLLKVAPRVAVHASVQLRLVPSEVAPRTVPVENLSVTGMFVSFDEPLPVGTVFGFALELPSLGEPVRGQAGVVRQATAPGAPKRGVGVRFLTLGGDAAERIDRFVREQRAAAVVSTQSGGRRAAEASGAFPALTSSGVLPRPAVADLPQLKEDLAELLALVDSSLRQGLSRRLGSVDWYLTGMELGLDSLHNFSALLETVHLGRAAAFETQNRIADLALVRRKLTDFALPQLDLRSRIQIMLDLRPPLDRLRRELAGASGAGASAAPRAPDAVAQLLGEIRRLIGNRRNLASVRSLLIDLGSTRNLFTPGAQRRIAERICREFPAQAAALGVATPERLASRSLRKEALAAAERELRALDARLAAIHERVYARRFRHLATGAVEPDLFDPKTLSILTDLLAPGREYLDRAYSAYQHALEIAGQPDLLERVAALAATVRAAELGQGAGAQGAPPAATGNGA